MMRYLMIASLLTVTALSAQRPATKKGDAAVTRPERGLAPVKFTQNDSVLVAAPPSAMMTIWAKHLSSKKQFESTEEFAKRAQSRNREIISDSAYWAVQLTTSESGDAGCTHGKSYDADHEIAVFEIELRDSYSDINVECTVKLDGSYAGQNAFGAKVRVQKASRRMFGITMPFAWKVRRIVVPLPRAQAARQFRDLAIAVLFHPNSGLDGSVSTMKAETVGPTVDSPSDLSTLEMRLNADKAYIVVFQRQTGRLVCSVPVLKNSGLTTSEEDVLPCLRRDRKSE